MRLQYIFLMTLLFIALGVPSKAQADGEPAEQAADVGPARSVLYYDVGRSFSFNCSLPRAPGQTYAWSKNGTAVGELWDLRERYELQEESAVFRMKGRTTEDDFGNYSCALGDAALHWDMRGRPHAKLPANTNVIDGQKLKLQCKLVGKPYPAVTWTLRDAWGNVSDAAAALGARAVLQSSAQGVAGAELLLAAARREDAGEYACVPAGGAPAATTVRVKDMYAALWPFLGICAEVFVLCAIILVYEKRRTKPELDDSDTDNHEQ